MCVCVVLLKQTPSRTRAGGVYDAQPVKPRTDRWPGIYSVINNTLLPRRLPSLRDVFFYPAERDGGSIDVGGQSGRYMF